MILQVTNPAGFNIPAMRELLREAFKPSNPDDLEGAVDQAIAMTGQGVFSVLVGIEEARPVAIIVLAWPQTVLYKRVQVLGLYQGGSEETRKALAEATMDLIRVKGYNKVLAVNATGRSDKAYARLLKPLGLKGKRVGVLMEYTV